MSQPRVRGSGVPLKKVKELNGSVATAIGAEWQPKAYELVKAVGEAGYVADRTANAIASGQLIPTEVVEGEVVPSDDERALRVMQAFVGQQGGQRELLRRASLHLTIGGESTLVGLPIPPEEGEGIFWEFLSTEEFRQDRTGKAERKTDALWTPINPEAFIARLHRADSALSWQADSTMRRVLPILAELAILQQLVEGHTKSRLAAGALFIPEELSFPGEDAEWTDGEEQIDELTEELLKHMSAPLEDPSSAASLVPLLLRGKGELGQYIRLVSLANPEDLDKAVKLRDDGLRRLARSLDIPPEDLEGFSNLSGLGGGNVAAEISLTWVLQFVGPQGDMLADFVAGAYLRPMLVGQEGLNAQEAGRFGVRFDASNLIGRNDTPETLRALWDEGLISDETYLRALGYDPGDMPKEDELFQRRVWQLVSTQPAVYGGLLPMLPGFENVKPADITAGAPPGGTPPPPNIVAPTAPSRVPPTRPAPPALPAPRPAAAMLAERLSVAADAALERAYEKAVARVLNLSRKHGLDIPGRVNGSSDPLRPLHVLQAGELERIGQSPTSLLTGAWDRLESRTRQWVAVYAEEQGADPHAAAKTAAVVGRELVTAMHEYAQLHLTEPVARYENGLAVPPALIERALDAAQPVG